MGKGFQIVKVHWILSLTVYRSKSAKYSQEINAFICRWLLQFIRPKTFLSTP